MEITKEDFYRIRAETYPLEDNEASIRYRNALPWMSLAAGMVVREIGCKFAILRDLLERHLPSADYAAVDIDEATLRKIPKYSPDKFICYNVNKGIPFPDSSTDYLICLEVLEHLENATAFFAEAKRVLKPGGKLILSVPNPYCWIECLSNFQRRSDTEGHICSFTGQNIGALLRFGGLALRGTLGTYTRIPLTRRIFGSYKLVETNSMLLSRSCMYLIEKP